MTHDDRFQIAATSPARRRAFARVRSAARAPGRDTRGDAVPSGPGIAARENPTEKSSRPEMAPQRLENTGSAPRNGSASETSKPQDLVRGRAQSELRSQQAWTLIPLVRRAIHSCPRISGVQSRLASQKDGAAWEPRRKFSVLQNFENSRNGERISNRGGLPDVAEIVAALAERGGRRAPRFPRADHAELTRSATASAAAA